MSMEGYNEHENKADPEGTSQTPERQEETITPKLAIERVGNNADDFIEGFQRDYESVFENAELPEQREEEIRDVFSEELGEVLDEARSYRQEAIAELRQLSNGADSVMSMRAERKEGATIGEEGERRKEESLDKIRQLRRERDAAKREQEKALEESQQLVNKLFHRFSQNIDSPSMLKELAELRGREAREKGQHAKNILQKQRRFEDEGVRESIKEEVYSRVLEPIKNMQGVEGEDLNEVLSQLDIRSLYFSAYSDYELDKGLPLGEKITKVISEKLEDTDTLSESHAVLAEITKDLYLSDAVVDGGLFKRDIEKVINILPQLLDRASSEELPALVEEAEQSMSSEMIEKLIMEGSLKDISLLKRLATNGAARIQRKIREKIEGGVSNSQAEDVGAITRLESAFSSEIMHHISQRLPELFNIPSSVADSWDMDVGKFRKNIATMHQIEDAGEGFVHLLNEFYGIHEFDRYPPEMLIEQAENHGKDGSYGVVMFPRYEFDGRQAFDKDQENFGALHEATRGEIVPRIFEIDSTTDLLRNFAKLRQQYEDKIRYLILGGHGTPDDIEFGEHERSSAQLDIEDVENSDALEGVKEMLADDVQAALLSCSTGAKGGIRDLLEEKLEISIDAPVTDSMFQSLKASMDESGHLNMEVEYQCNTRQEAYTQLAQEAKEGRENIDTGN